MFNELQSILNSQIPLTNAMGIKVKELTYNSLTLTAPLENNKNHLNTGFAGSLYSIAVLTAWGLIDTVLRNAKLEAHIVIQKGEIEYLKPVESDLLAKCSFENDDSINILIDTFMTNKKAKIELNSNIINECGEIYAQMKGKFVIYI